MFLFHTSSHSRLRCQNPQQIPPPPLSSELINVGGKGTEIYVRVRNFQNGIEYYWPRDKFQNRFFKMQELYEDVEAGEISLKKLPDDQVREDCRHKMTVKGRIPSLNH